ncbi:MAG: DUF2179 domain-containing protein [Syntrophaceae bacterium]|nr:DUF2179 domain-containing protein [Deltaproteobacteria bacterium]
MDMSAFMDSSLYTWGLLPFLIFLARIGDVSLDTVRIIFISRNLKYYAAVIGFFEVMIWLLAIRQIFQNLGNPVCFVAYAAGFATGNFVGIIIENKLSIGKVIMRIIARECADDLVSFLRSAGYGITIIQAEGSTGPVRLIFSIVERQNLEHIVDMIKKYNPQAFYSIEDVRFVSEAVTPFRLPTLPRWHPGSRRKVK